MRRDNDPAQPKIKINRLTKEGELLSQHRASPQLWGSEEENECVTFSVTPAVRHTLKGKSEQGLACLPEACSLGGWASSIELPGQIISWMI